jgi:hypothetical protein
MDSQDAGQLPTLPAHKYPMWIMLFAGGLLLLTAYSFFLLPNYLVAVKQLKAAEAAYRNSKFNDSIQLYKSVLSAVPLSKKARLGAAEAIFANGDKEDDKDGMSYLSGLKLDKDDWSRITKVMPAEDQQYFDQVKE